MTVFFSFSVAACILSARSPRARLSASQGIPALAGPDSGGAATWDAPRQCTYSCQDSALIRGRHFWLKKPKKNPNLWPFLRFFAARGVGKKSDVPKEIAPRGKKECRKNGKRRHKFEIFLRKKAKKMRKKAAQRLGAALRRQKRFAEQSAQANWLSHRA